MKILISRLRYVVWRTVPKVTYFPWTDKLATKLMKIAKTGFDSSKTRSFKHPRNLCMKTAPLIWLHTWRGLEDIGEKFIIRI